jgi:predicted RNase H-like HicB family nuclease
MAVYRFTVVIERDEEGYFVFCPELQGCYTQGATYEEAVENIKDAIRLHVADRLENGRTAEHRVEYTKNEIIKERR